MTEGSDQLGAGSAAIPAAAPMGVGGVMTVGSILTVARILLVFVIFTFGLVSLLYCFSACDRRRQGVWVSPSRRRRHGVGTAGSTRTRGVDAELLRLLPVTVYRATAGPKEEAVECAVCLVELEDGEEARFLPRCGHGFHAECIDMWLASHSTCPLCRLTVAKPDVPLLPHGSPEPANYATNLPASVILGWSDHGLVTTDGPSTSNGTTAGLVIEIRELAVPSPTPRDAAKSPGLARLRSIRRLLSFGRQGAGTSSSCSCSGASEGADME